MRQLAGYEQGGIVGVQRGYRSLFRSQLDRETLDQMHRAAGAETMRPPLAPIGHHEDLEIGEGHVITLVHFVPEHPLSEELLVDEVLGGLERGLLLLGQRLDLVQGARFGRRRGKRGCIVVIVRKELVYCTLLGAIGIIHGFFHVGSGRT